MRRARSNLNLILFLSYNFFDHLRHVQTCLDLGALNRFHIQKENESMSAKSMSQQRFTGMCAHPSKNLTASGVSEETAVSSWLN